MLSAPRLAAVALLVLLVLFGQGRAQQLPPSPATSSMPSPVLMTDPGARCSGWVPCPTIDPWDVTLRIDPWYASPAAGRSEAGGVRAGLILDVARHLEGGLSAAMLAWNTLDQPAARVLGWNILGAHLRASVPLGALSLVGTYQHDWDLGGAGYGLLQAGQTAGRASAAAHLPLFSSLFSSTFTIGGSAGIAYNPSGAATVELGVRAAVTPADPQHHVSLWLEGGVQQPVRGAAGGPSAWAGFGFSSLSSGGGELGGALLLNDSDGARSVMCAFKLAGHFGMDYRPPEFLLHHEDPDELVTALAKRPQPSRALPPLLPRPQLALARPPALQRPLGPQLAQGPAGPGPGAWYPPGLPERPQGPAGPARTRPGSALASYLHPRPPRLVWGQIARPPVRPPLPPMPRTGLRAERGIEGEPEQRDRVEDEGGYRLNQLRREASRRAAEAPPRGDWEPERDADAEGPVLRPGHAEHAPPPPPQAAPVRPVPEAVPEHAPPARAQAPWGAGGPPPWERPAPPAPEVAEHARPSAQTNPYKGPVTEPVTIVDPPGNAIRVRVGERLEGSPDGRYVQVKGPNGRPTGVRYDGGGHPPGPKHPGGQGPHAHVPGVTNPDGTPWLPIKR